MFLPAIGCISSSVTATWTLGDINFVLLKQKNLSYKTESKEADLPYLFCVAAAVENKQEKILHNCLKKDPCNLMYIGYVLVINSWNGLRAGEVLFTSL